MSLKIRSTLPKHDRDPVVVHVRDPAFERLEAEFDYLVGDAGRVALVGVGVGPAPRTAKGKTRVLTVTDVRDMPMSRWEKAARAHVVARLRGAMEQMTDVLAKKHPTSDRLEQVADAYRRNVAAGLHDPAAEIARSHDVAPATARSWIHRARKAGLLGPAVGPTAGERTTDEEEGNP